jgi:hypothetical protein
MEGDVSQLPGLIKEWMSTEDELKTLNAEIREKRKRVKLVRQMITSIMKGGKIGRLNISSGAVMARSKKSKAPLTKKYLTSTLTEFFKGDAAMAQACFQFLEEHRPLKVVDSISLETNV